MPSAGTVDETTAAVGSRHAEFGFRPNSGEAYAEVHI
jgi:hypothetical protein